MKKGQLLTWISKHEYVDAQEMCKNFILSEDKAHEMLVSLHNEGYLGAMSAENDSTLFGITCKGKEYLNQIMMFFRVYQDSLSMDSFYVDTKEGIKNSLGAWRGYVEDSGELFPVIEPVLMTQKEFDDLPEFEGY